MFLGHSGLVNLKIKILGKFHSHWGQQALNSSHVC